MITKATFIDARSHHSAGFTLLELLLVTGVMILISAASLQIFDDWSEKTLNQRVARQYLVLQDAAEDYVTTNFEQVISRAPTTNSVGEITLTEMRNAGFLSNGFPNQSIFKQAFAVYIRNKGNTTNGTALEIITIGENVSGDRSVPESRLRSAALAGGSRLGLYSRRTNSLGVASVEGFYQNWAIPYSAINALHTGTISSTGTVTGYLAAYGEVAQTDLANPNYLYRVPIYNASGERQYEYNRMEANLDMNNYDLEDVAGVTVDHMDVDGNIQINAVNMNTAGFTPFAFSVDQQLTSAGNNSRIQYGFTADSDPGCRIIELVPGVKTVDVPAAATCNLAGGDLAIDGDNVPTLVDLHIRGDLRVADTTSTRTAEVRDTINQYGTAKFDFVDAQEVSTGRVSTDETVLQGDINATEFSSSVDTVPGTTNTLNIPVTSTRNLIANNIIQDSTGAGAVTVQSGSVRVEEGFDSSGGLDALNLFSIRRMEMDECLDHPDCTDPNIIVVP